jgi:hypothetical protein
VSSQTLSPVADTYVRAGAYAAQNFGSARTLLAKKGVSADNTSRAYVKFDVSHISDESSRSPSHVTFPRRRRMTPWPRVRISNRSASSTAARFVRAPLLRIACRISLSSMSMFVRITSPDV